MNKQRGFSLIETMIALVIGLVLTGGAISAFVGLKRAGNSTTGIAALSDGGRIATDQIEQAVRNAGYLACSPVGADNALNDLVAGSSKIYYDYSEPLAGYEYTGTAPGGAYTVATPAVVGSTTGDWASPAAQGSTLDPALMKDALFAGQGGVVPGSDVLVVHETLTGAVPVFMTTVSNAGDSSVTTNLASAIGNTQITVGRTGIISDCRSSEIFQIGGVVGGTITLGGTQPGNTTTGLRLEHGIGSRVSIVNTTVFYIGVGQDGDGALFSMDMNGTGAFLPPVELVSDIENMQVLYGIDTDGSLRASEYVTADNIIDAIPGVPGYPADFNSVINIKLALLVAGPLGSAVRPATASTYSLLGTTITAPQDTRLRKVFESVVALRNTSP